MIRRFVIVACLLAATTARGGDVRVTAVDAIGLTVSDADRSVDFYSRILGFTKVSDVEVTGESWEHLRGVFPLRITGLRAADGPGIEFLEYVTPRDGRPFPSDERANDLVHWQTRLVARDGASMEKLGQGRPVALPAHELGFARGLVVRDPDGHALEMVEP